MAHPKDVDPFEVRKALDEHTETYYYGYSLGRITINVEEGWVEDNEELLSEIAQSFGLSLSSETETVNPHRAEAFDRIRFVKG